VATEDWTSHLLLDGEDPARLWIDVDLDPVNQFFTVRLDSRKEQVWQRLVDEEKVVVA
jgi:hypothetical protein